MNVGSGLLGCDEQSGRPDGTHILTFSTQIGHALLIT